MTLTRDDAIFAHGVIRYPVHCSCRSGREDGAMTDHPGISMSLELRYHPSLEQRALADTFNDSIKALLPLDRLHASHSESERVWQQLEDVGLFTACLDEEAGGSGLGAAEEALIVMELGRRLACSSVIATIGATHAKDIGESPVSGRTWRAAAAYRNGARIVSIGGDKADAVLLRDGDGAALHRNSGTMGTIDATLWYENLHEGAALQSSIAEFDAKGVRRLRLIDAAVLAGIAVTALDTGVAYAGERRQFGRPIGGFQAVKHHCANMAIAARNARDQVGFASVAIDEDREDAALQVDCALLVAGTAALRNTAANIQIHGGIGFSEEALPHILLKRARLLIAIAGGLEAANVRIADASAGPAACRGNA
ncbi:acyl-CoA dehydrogenase family protein [Luteimonas sp. BDR2-5]|uniref:acyl-CoA dehydrogenase n=1 Tax=Proluteimonas luteida TaxID=2878685 RepID=UPI001E597214|nr:acyl-CoA dehydrogenase [Luteimonas sp. BDR2-5]MCD9028068.1 acyl-CoA dehydrogenase family protein [Luteimonas sp. BDR2-5]